MAKQYEVKVVVEYYFDVEAESVQAAEEYASYHYQEYAHTAETYSIEAELLSEECDNCALVPDECECDDCDCDKN